MLKHADNRLIAGLVGLLAISVVLVVIADWALGTTLDSIAVARLAAGSRDGLVDLQVQNLRLQVEVDSLRLLVAERSQRRRPTIEQIHDLCRQRGLSVRALERITGSPEALKYRVTVDGRAGDLVSFLMGLEQKHILETSGLQLYPANQDGSRVALSIQLNVSES